MDIKEFYPNITKQILDNALNFAMEHTTISENELRTINHCRKSLLFSNNVAWKKNKSHDSFDVTMGSFDGAEICELVGIYILNDLSKITDKRNIGLYRDDGLAIFRNLKSKDADSIRKEIIKIFKEIGFDIEINIDLKSVDFLDLTLDLNTGTYRPYKKPNDKLSYVHTSSNHPQNIIKQLPLSINKRLSKNSSNETIFNQAKPIYEEALKTSGYKNVNLSYNNYSQNTENHRTRKRKIIWFNPPYNKNVTTNVGKTFLKLIDKHFTKANKLYSIFNKNNVKVSYSCTENVRSIINSHNKKTLSKPENNDELCNCRDKNTCPLDNKCKIKSVIYKCEVTAPNHGKKSYIGLTEREFKQRFSSHKSSINNVKYKNSTTLSTYVWSLKEKDITPTLKWSILKRVKSYSNTSKTCRLCLQEKLEILRFENKEELLNKRSEIISKCRHMNKFMLANYKSKD